MNVVEVGIAIVAVNALIRVVEMTIALIRGNAQRDTQENTKDMAFITLIKDFSANVRAHTLALQEMQSCVEDQGATIAVIQSGVSTANKVLATVPETHQGQNLALEAIQAGIERLPAKVKAELNDDFGAVKNALSEAVNNLGSIYRKVDQIQTSMEATTNGKRTESRNVEAVDPGHPTSSVDPVDPRDQRAENPDGSAGSSGGVAVLQAEGPGSGGSIQRPGQPTRGADGEGV